jgi:hypothetical protein
MMLPISPYDDPASELCGDTGAGLDDPILFIGVTG